MHNFKYDFYKVLQLPRFSSFKEIKTAYRRLALKHHPDRAGGSEALMKLVNLAYNTLTRHKAEYDHWLKLRLGIIQPVIVQFYQYGYYHSASGTVNWSFATDYGGATNAT